MNPILLVVFHFLWGYLGPEIHLILRLWYIIKKEVFVIWQKACGLTTFEFRINFGLILGFVKKQIQILKSWIKIIFLRLFLLLKLQTKILLWLKFLLLRHTNNHPIWATIYIDFDWWWLFDLKVLTHILVIVFK